MKKLLLSASLFIAAISAKANSLTFFNSTSCTYYFSIRCHDAALPGCSSYSVEIAIPPGFTNFATPLAMPLVAAVWSPSPPSSTGTFDDIKGGLLSSCFQFELGDCLSTYSFMCATGCSGAITNALYSMSGPNVVVNIW